MVSIADSLSKENPTLTVPDPAGVPESPPLDIKYYHKLRYGRALRALWSRREIIYTLAERDIRAQYKQAALGIAWALLAPLALLGIMTVVFTRVKTFHTGIQVPYQLYAYVGILPWTFFSSSLQNGGASLLANKILLNKIQFPRECFPLALIAESGFSTVLALIPLAILFAVHTYPPKLETLWAPLFIVIELAYTIGVTLAISAIVIYVRDLQQALPIIVQLGIFATPVIWPFSLIPHALQPLYSFLNPVGPVIDNLRLTMLAGHAPDWAIVIPAVVGATFYLVVGYTIFKRLEVGFADIA